MSRLKQLILTDSATCYGTLRDGRRVRITQKEAYEYDGSQVTAKYVHVECRFDKGVRRRLIDAKQALLHWWKPDKHAPL